MYALSKVASSHHASLLWLQRISANLRRKHSESERVSHLLESSCNSDGEHDDDLDDTVII